MRHWRRIGLHIGKIGFSDDFKFNGCLGFIGVSVQVSVMVQPKKVVRYMRSFWRYFLFCGKLRSVMSSLEWTTLKKSLMTMEINT